MACPVLDLPIKDLAIGTSSSGPTIQKRRPARCSCGEDVRGTIKTVSTARSSACAGVPPYNVNER